MSLQNEISEEDITLYGDVIKKNPLNLVEVFSTVITHATNLLTKEDQASESKDKEETSQEDQAKVLSQVLTQLDESTKQELIKLLSKDTSKSPCL